MYTQEVKDRAGAISKDLDEGTFNVAQGTGPNLTQAIDDAFKKVTDAILDNIKK